MFWCKKGLPPIFSTFTSKGCKVSAVSFSVFCYVKFAYCEVLLNSSTRLNFGLNRANYNIKEYPAKLLFSNSL